VITESTQGTQDVTLTQMLVGGGKKIPLPWGLGLLVPARRKVKLLVRSLLPAIVLIPVYVVIGIAVRLSDFQTLKIHLGKEWRRTQPVKRSTFTAGGPRLQVMEIGFPESGVFSYRVKDSTVTDTIRMNAI